MKPDLDNYLNFEIKKEMADRYFGFRKLIEEDKIDYAEKIRQYSFILEKRISFDLIRIYILLKDEALIHRFLKLANIEQELFYDPYLTESVTIRERVFRGIRLRGFTRRRRFKFLLFDCYERLEGHVQHYREKFEELMTIQETISQEVALFYRKNDLGTMMGFLRSLSAPSVASGMAGGMEIGLGQDLDRKMLIEPPLPIEHFLPVLQSLTPLPTIRRELKKLYKTAYTLQDQDFLAQFTRQGFPMAERSDREG